MERVHGRIILIIQIFTRSLKVKALCNGGIEHKLILLHFVIIVEKGALTLLDQLSSSFKIIETRLPHLPLDHADPLLSVCR